MSPPLHIALGAQRVSERSLVAASVDNTARNMLQRQRLGFFPDARAREDIGDDLYRP